MNLWFKFLRVTFGEFIDMIGILGTIFNFYTFTSVSVFYIHKNNTNIQKTGDLTFGPFTLNKLIWLSTSDCFQLMLNAQQNAITLCKNFWLNETEEEPMIDQLVRQTIV